MTPKPPATSRSAQRTGHGFQMSKIRNSRRARTQASGLRGAARRTSHCAATSSTTTAPGSLIPLALVTVAAAHHPAKKTSAVATASPIVPQRLRITQAKGKAASEPQVPGAIGINPTPNQVASSTAGCRSGRLRRALARIMLSRRLSPLTLPLRGSLPLPASGERAGVRSLSRASRS